MKIKCVTFDLDDTLWSIYPVIARAESCFLDWMKEHLPRIAESFSAEELSSHRHDYFVQYPELHHDFSLLRKKWMVSLMAEHGYPDHKMDEGFAVFWRERNTLDLFEHAENTLDRIKQKFRIGAITNGNADLNLIGIHHYFDFFLTSAAVGYSKPHPTIFETAIIHAQCEPDQIVHVGDDPLRDVQGAADAGMKTVWVNLNDEAWNESVQPDATICSLEELPETIDRLAADS